MQTVDVDLPAPVSSQESAAPMREDPLLGAVLRWWAPALVALYLFRLWYCWWRELVPDEAVYWAWSRHLELSYFDHPPMVALLIRASTTLFGSTELGVRFGAATLAFGAAAILIVLARRLYRDPMIVAIVALLWLTSPLLMGLATLVTPDTPAIFLSVCAMAMAVEIFRDGRAARSLDWRWIIFGVCCGLAMLSKYTTVLVPGSIFLAMLTSRAGRAQLRRPGIYLSGIVALLLFLPVIVWNARHDWISFRFQLGHGLGRQSGGPLLLLEWIGGQALIWTPMLLAITVLVLVRCWRNCRKLDDVEWILLWCATVPLIFFGLSAIRSRGEPNWPAFAYFPASLLLARYVAENLAGTRWQWTRLSCVLALAAALLAPFPDPLWRAGIPWIKRMDDLVGWRQLVSEINGVADGAPIISNRHQDAGMVAFYSRGQPPVLASSVGSRPTAFDYVDNAPDPRQYPKLLFLGAHDEEFCTRYGFSIEKTGRVTIKLPSARERSRLWSMLKRLP
jgi:4-amino-4-deoxy-L-arabinose transferase-like glycosyltransferase